MLHFTEQLACDLPVFINQGSHGLLVMITQSAYELLLVLLEDLWLQEVGLRAPGRRDGAVQTVRPQGKVEEVQGRQVPLRWVCQLI